MKKFIAMALAALLVITSIVCFASCKKQEVKTVEVIREVEVPVEVEKIVEVEVEKVVEVEKETAEINGMTVTGTYATQDKAGKVTVTVKYIDKVLNPAFDPTKDADETNQLYVTGATIATINYTVDYTYTTLIFGGNTYTPALPGAVEVVEITGFFAMNGAYLYATDATHAIVAEDYVDTMVLPAEAVEQLTTGYEFVTFQFAD